MGKRPVSKEEPRQVSKTETEALLSLFKETLEKNIPGDIVEFGCYKGDTSVLFERHLEKFRKENKGNDEMELQIKTKARSISFIVCACVVFLFFVVDTLFLETGIIRNTAQFFIFTLYFTDGLVRGILGKRKKAIIFYALCCFILAICIVLFILGLVF